MKTIKEVILLASEHLARRGIERSQREAEELIADQLHCRRLDLFLQFDRVLTEQELVACRAALRLRAEHTPLAYISQKVEFAGIELKITPDVLIPRPETEILVEMIAKEHPQGKVLDLCTGSGAIGLALKHRYPQLEVTLADISSKALAVAQENATQLGLDVTFIQSDLLSNIKEKFDLIVCNPPYLSQEDYEKVSLEVKQEPQAALVAGFSGYEFYERLAQCLDSPVIWLEIGASMGFRVCQLFIKKDYKCQLIPDYAGHDRYLSLRR